MLKSYTIVIATFLWSCSLGQIIHHYPTFSYNSIQKLPIQLPYIKLYGTQKRLIVFGSNHTNNFYDVQIKQILDSIISFNPTVILYEGDGIATEKTQKATVETYFEMGFAKFIADSLHIKAINIEPNTKSKYTYLLKKYATDDILLATLGLQITMLQRGNANFEKKFPKMIADLKKEGLPLNNRQQTLNYYYTLYKKNFGKVFNYNNFDSRDIQSKYNRTKFNKINQRANEFRDQHIIHLTKNYLDKNERVFLIVGGWHAIVCEPAFRIMTANK